jgi:hypothetical protein
MKGSFTPSSGRMYGSYKERTYEYEVIQIERIDNKTVTKNIDTDDLRTSHDIFFRIKGGHIPKGEFSYRHIYGPYESQADMEAAITDMMLYGSP